MIGISIARTHALNPYDINFITEMILKTKIAILIPVISQKGLYRFPGIT